MIAKFFMAAALTCDPAWAALFTPLHPRLGHYEVCVTANTLPGVMADSSLGLNYGTVERLEALDAFGPSSSSGSYDRPRLSRLYNGRRLDVVRGWKQTGDRFESVTLLSPYPNQELTALLPGTMIIRWTLVQSDGTAEAVPYRVNDNRVNDNRVNDNRMNDNRMNDNRVNDRVQW